MLVPPVTQGGTSGHQVGDHGARVVQNSVSATATAEWPIAAAHIHPSGSQQSQAPPPSAATPVPSHNQGINRYELYSLFPGSGSGGYVATTPGSPTATSARTYHATTHKESIFSAAVGVGGYTWGAPTPPPGSPYSPVPAMTHLELLAKNLATLTPHHAHQSVSLQGAIGVNIGTSLHHAHHTQHTLNLAGLHHIHHGESTMTTTSTTSFTSKFIDERTLTLDGLHQNPFSSHLSLVTADIPTLTINSFSSPSAQPNMVPTNSGVLIQEYQSTGPRPITACQSAINGSCSITASNSAATHNISTVMVHGTTTGPSDTNFAPSSLTKKIESFITPQAQTSIKMENKTTNLSCICKNTNINNINGKTKNVQTEAGCSRTLPVVSSWNNHDTFADANVITQNAATNLVKRESLATVPCQVAEVSTSLHATATAVKIEPPKSRNGIVVSTATTTGIPVGIAVARQRLQHQETSSTSMRNVSLSHHTSHHASYHHFQPNDSLGSATAMAVGGATLLHCGAGGDNRTSHLAIPSGALAPSINAATLHSGLSSIGSGAPGAWPPTLWHYPTTAMPAMEPIGFPQVGVGLQSGLQLVRDPTTGHLLLIHAPAEQMQQAVIWPNYPNHGGANVAAPSPLLLPGPTPPSLQLFNDINGARLVLTENKRKQHSTMPIIKIEADCASPSATIIASTESNKSLQTVTTMTGSVMPEPPLLTTLHYYPHAPALVQINHAESTQYRTQQRNTFISKTASPVSCLTPPPEITHATEVMENSSALAVQDASNQTDAPDFDDHFSIDGFIKQEQRFSAYNQSALATCTNFDDVSSSAERSQTPSSSIRDRSIVPSQPHVITDKMNELESIDVGDSHATKSEGVSLIDETIERVVSYDSNHIEAGDTQSSSVDDEDNIFERRIPRFGSKLIEITEENCDSFHENLEFFGRRHDPVEQYRKSFHAKQQQSSLQSQSNEKVITLRSKDDDVNRLDPHVPDQDICHSVSSTFDESVALTHNAEANEPCGMLKLFNEPIKPCKVNSSCHSEIGDNEIESQIIIKSLDMPSIDCDEQHQTNMCVKQEFDDTKESTNLHTVELVNGNTISEKVNHFEKKQCPDKIHPGIENVVEKLKKNAAAAASQDRLIVKKSIDWMERTNDINSSSLHTSSNAVPHIITSNNGLKKHILHLCKISSLAKESRTVCEETDNVSAEIVNSTLNSQNFRNLSCINGMSNSTNNNVNSTEKTSLIIQNKHQYDDLLKPVSNSSVDEAIAKKKSNVDLSGLELLSNSIAQLEQLKPTESSPKKDLTSDQQKESNNNDVDSPLGLLCALAEQRFMEEVGHDVPNRRTNNENMEKISQVGTSLMNFTKVVDHDSSQIQKTISEKGNNGKDENSCANIKRSKECAFEALELESQNCKNIMIDNARKYEHECEKDDADDDCTDSEPENIKNPSFSPACHLVDRTNEDETTITCGRIKGVDTFEKKNDEKEKNWSNSRMDAMELNMREKLADIQKKYKEKQKELFKLSPKKDDSNCHGRSRTKSSEREYLPVDNQNQDSLPMKLSIKSDDDIPPSQSPSALGMPKCNVNLVKLGELRSHIKLLDNIPSKAIVVTPQASLETVSSVDDINTENEGCEIEVTKNSDNVIPISTTPTSSSASKKRKVGRPRKFMCTSTSARHLTETIVAKKSRTKGSLISYMLNSKNRQLQCKLNSKGSHNPLASKCGVSNLKGIAKSINKSEKSTVKSVKQTQLHNKNVICSIIAEKTKLSQEAKLEKQMMKWTPTETTEVIENVEKLETNKKLNYRSMTVTDKNNEILQKHHRLSEQLPQDSLNTFAADKNECRSEKCDKLKKKKRKSISYSPLRHKASDNAKSESKRRKSSDCRECKECAKVARAVRIENIENIANRCKLTSTHLSVDQLRVLTAMGGLFYAGRLSAVQAPDIYAITLDGERGNRPHIHSREEILQDAIVEVCPTSTKELTPGTRLCAYWSQQYRCLYPGTSVVPSEPDSELDEKFVSVEFDDGDSGKIALNDIRLLQPDYPVVEYDPNPLLTLGKRRRRTSTSTDDKRLSNDSHSTTKIDNSQSIESTIHSPTSIADHTGDDLKKMNEFNKKALDEYRERKKYKKRRRDKLKRLQDVALVNDGKRKHRRHKCCEEHRKHKHRKHHKNKRRHSHHASYSEGSNYSGVDSCSGNISEGDLNENTIANKKSSANNESLYTDQTTAASLSELPQSTELKHEEHMPDVTADKLKKSVKKIKTRERQESVESRSKMAAFLPARQLWGWSGKGYRRPGAKGRAKKQFFKAIQRGKEAIQIGDSAVFLSTGRPDRPYIGKIESMWETTNSNMIVKVKWFYHPEETVGAPAKLKYPGALFESPHMDENDVQTISHKCEVLPLPDYTAKLEKEPHRYLTIYDNNDIYYLAGYYDPTTYLLTLQPGVV